MALLQLLATEDVLRLTPWWLMLVIVGVIAWHATRKVVSTLLIVGAELLVRCAVRMAANLKVRPLLIGLTVVALGSSAPITRNSMIRPNSVRLPRIDDKLASAVADRVASNAMKPPRISAPG